MLCNSIILWCVIVSLCGLLSIEPSYEKTLAPVKEEGGELGER